MCLQYPSSHQDWRIEIRSEASRTRLSNLTIPWMVPGGCWLDQVWVGYSPLRDGLDTVFAATRLDCVEAFHCALEVQGAHQGVRKECSRWIIKQQDLGHEAEQMQT